jgi:hypothetical protein
MIFAVLWTAVMLFGMPLACLLELANDLWCVIMGTEEKNDTHSGMDFMAQCFMCGILQIIGGLAIAVIVLLVKLNK